LTEELGGKSETDTSVKLFYGSESVKYSGFASFLFSKLGCRMRRTKGKSDHQTMDVVLMQSRM